MTYSDTRAHTITLTRTHTHSHSLSTGKTGGRGHAQINAGVADGVACFLFR